MVELSKAHQPEVLVAHANARLTPAGRMVLCQRIAAGRPVAHVAAEMGTSRTTAYCWWTRFRQHGQHRRGQEQVPGPQGQERDGQQEEHRVVGKDHLDPGTGIAKDEADGPHGQRPDDDGRGRLPPAVLPAVPHPLGGQGQPDPDQDLGGERRDDKCLRQQRRHQPSSYA